METRISPSLPVPSTRTNDAPELTPEEAATIRARMTALDDAGLRRVVGVDSEQYRAGALEIAWDEIRARGLPIDPAAAEAERRAHVRPLGLDWMWAYMGLTAVGVVWQLFLTPRTMGSDSDVAGLLVGTLLNAMLIVGLVMRRRWALWLNHVWLALGAVVYLGGGHWLTGLAYVMLWAIPNALYFHRRRALFRPGFVGTRNQAGEGEPEGDGRR